MSIIVGIDEAGRGCWAGPLVAAAVVLHRPIDGIGDSKQLSRKRREQLSEIIRQSASFGIGWVYPNEIDEIGLTASTAKAMNEALNQITTPYEEIIIDGNYNYLQGLSDGLWPKVRTIIKADASVQEVGAASILAKVARDEYMAEMDIKYPKYRFASHVGYGTALHHELLKLHGVCDIHRLSYKPLKALLNAD